MVTGFDVENQAVNTLDAFGISESYGKSFAHRMVKRVNELTQPALESYQSPGSVCRWWPSVAMTLIFAVLVYSIVTSFNQKFELKVLGSNRISTLALKVRVYLEKSRNMTAPSALPVDPDKIIEFIEDQTSISARFTTARSTMETILSREQWKKLVDGNKTWDHFASEVFEGIDTGLTGPSGIRRFMENLGFRLRIYDDKLQDLSNVLSIAESIMKSSLENYRVGLMIWLTFLGIGYGVLLLLMQRHPLLSFRYDPMQLPGFLVAPLRAGTGEESGMDAPDESVRTDTGQASELTARAQASSSQGSLKKYRVKDSATEASKDQLEILKDQLKRSEAAVRSLKLEVEAQTENQTRFLSNLSHEIRTPLNGIMGMVELLSETPVDATQSELVDLLKSSNRNLFSLIDSMIEFPSLCPSDSSVASDQRSIKLTTVIEDAIAIFTEPVVRKNIELEAVYGPDLPDKLEGNPQKLHQILVNLLSNAVRFTDSGGITMAVELEVDNADEWVISFTVQDSGIGIPLSARPHLFKPISDHQSLGLESRDGHGLGLSITRELVESLNGSITYAEAPSGGAVFRCVIPFPKVSQLRQGPLFPRFQHFYVVCLTQSNVLKQAFTGFSKMMKFPAAVVDTPARFWGVIETWSGLKSSVLTLVIDDQVVDSDSLKKLLSVMDNFRERFTDGPNIASILVSPLASERISSTEWSHRNDVRVCYRPLKINDFSMALTEINQGINSSRPDKRFRKRISFESELKVLAVEDAAISRELFSKQLQLLGLSFEIVSDGLEALELLNSRRFDVILMDCNLPHLDGFATTRKIRENPEFKDICIIGITANADPAIHAKCLQAGMDDHLTKPLALKALETAIYDRFPEFIF